MHDLWVQHTASVHRPTDTTSATHTHLVSKITDLQHLHLRSCPLDTSYHLTTATLDAATVFQLRNWINLHEEQINLDIKVRHQARRHRQHLITDFFDTGPGPPSSTTTANTTT